MGEQERKLKNKFNTFLGILIVIALFIIILKLLVWTEGISTKNLFWAALPDFLPFLLLIICGYLEKLKRELNLSRAYDIAFSAASIVAIVTLFLP